MFHSGAGFGTGLAGSSAGLAGTETHPESNPPATGWQGLAKLDCVTVWFPGLERSKSDKNVKGRGAPTLQ
jgi:hypothetical protein